MRRVSSAYNIDDLRSIARRRLPRGVFEFIDRGTEDEVALTDNVAYWRRLKLVPRQPRDVGCRDARTVLFGQTISMPVVIAPTGAADILWHKGERAAARAAQAAGIPFTLATSSTTPMREIFEITQGGMWLQVYMWENREKSHELISDAQSMGVETLVLTVDTPLIPNREFNSRNGFVNPFRVKPGMIADLALHPGWCLAVMGRYLLEGGLPRYANYPAEASDSITSNRNRLPNAASLTWDDIARVRDSWKGRFLLKGILHPDDALRAADIGADGIVVSNHGGRNLDSAPVAAAVFPAIQSAVGQRLTLLLDGGVRRGSDVVKAMALGANAVLVGKATLYGLAAGGQPGVARMLELLADEIDCCLALAGRPSIRDLTGMLHPS